jgi:hypothetical protein
MAEKVMKDEGHRDTSLFAPKPVGNLYPISKQDQIGFACRFETKQARLLGYLGRK